MSNTPSDAEIVALMRDGYNCRYNDEADHIDFARAVLARWGAQPTPSSAAEFALQALVAAGHVSQELVDRALALPGAPQPVARAPLTDEQWQRIADLTNSILTRATKDEIERVIGIKGGQNADT